MFYLKDKSKDVWSSISRDFKTVEYEDGTSKDLECSDLIMEFPRKYKGTVLSDVDDVGLLRWLYTVVVEKEDEWGKYCVTMRGKELT